MKIAFFGDSLTEGRPGVPYFDILNKRYPQHKLLNFGKGGDTAISLYRRLKKTEIPRDIDLSFLWIGTNDVWVHASRRTAVFKTLRRQPWAKDNREFMEYYLNLISLLKKHSKKVIVVSVSILGEDIDNKLNHQAEVYSNIIGDLARELELEYLDIRKLLFKEIKKSRSSQYLVRSYAVMLWDHLFLTERDKVDVKAAKRGLRFTLDGAHLNGAGADLVVNSFGKWMDKY